MNTTWNLFRWSTTENEINWSNEFFWGQPIFGFLKAVGTFHDLSSQKHQPIGISVAQKPFQYSCNVHLLQMFKYPSLFFKFDFESIF